MIEPSATTGNAHRNQDASTEFLEPAEFCRLLLSRKRLVRVDSTGDQVRILLDRSTGKRYQIDQRRLDQFVEGERPRRMAGR